MAFMINRRRFVQTASASLALASLGAEGLEIINDGKTRRVGLIGAGWYGKSDTLRLIQVAPVEVVALADVDSVMAEGAAQIISERQKSGKRPQIYSDYEKMLAEHEFDIVLVGTPDHWHALPAIAAIEAGAHVYLQKPISVDVLEGEAILAAARKHNRVVQIGTQRRSTPHLVDAKNEIVDAGLLGNISHAEVCCYYHMRFNDRPALSDAPERIDYDRWAGPAPKIPYTTLPHRGLWRGRMEYCNGIMGDMCVHMLDAVRWTLDLGWPTSVSSTGGIYVQKDSWANTYDTQSALFKFDELDVVWQHRSWGDAPNSDYPWAYMIYGDKGTLKADVRKFEFTPRGGNAQAVKKECLFEREQFPEDIDEPGMELHAAPATRRQMLDFLAAIETGAKPVADVEQGHISTASCIMANMSVELDRTLHYDPAKKTVTGDEEATKLLARPYREGWTRPTV